MAKTWSEVGEIVRQGKNILATKRQNRKLKFNLAQKKRRKDQPRLVDEPAGAVYE